MTYDPRFWDPIHHAAADLRRDGWVPLRDATYETLRVLRDISGHPDVERDDPEVAAFAFCLLRVLIDQAGLSPERADALAQGVAAQVYHDLPSDGRPAPEAFWELLCDRAGTYARDLDERTENMGLVTVVGRFVTRYGLTPKDDPEIVRGLCRAVSPAVVQARRYAVARRDVLERWGAPEGDEAGLDSFLELDDDAVARVLEAIESEEVLEGGGSEDPWGE